MATTKNHLIEVEVTAHNLLRVATTKNPQINISEFSTELVKIEVEGMAHNLLRIP